MTVGGVDGVNSTATWHIAPPSSSGGQSFDADKLRVLERDHDVGYQIMRVSPRQKWRPSFLFQPLWNVLLAVLFVRPHGLFTRRRREKV